MNILRWIVITAIVMAFLLLSVANWTPVPFSLPNGTIVTTPLPILLAIAFTAGWLPTWLLHLGTKATMKRKLGRYERPDETPAPSALPSQAQPTIVPPAGA